MNWVGKRFRCCVTYGFFVCVFILHADNLGGRSLKNLAHLSQCEHLKRCISSSTRKRTMGPSLRLNCCAAIASLRVAIFRNWKICHFRTSIYRRQVPIFQPIAISAQARNRIYCFCSEIFLEMLQTVPTVQFRYHLPHVGWFYCEYYNYY